MHWPLSSQGVLFIRIIFLGIVISFCYDIMRFFRKIIPHKFYVMQIEDVFYWLSAVFIVFTFFIRERYGEIRLFSVLALLSGMLGYFFFLSPGFMKICDIPAQHIRNTFLKSGILINAFIKKHRHLYLNEKNILHFRGKYARIKVRKK